MQHTISFLKLVTLAVLFTGLTAVVERAEIFAAELALSWTDNANNEDGFRIERKTGTGGTYVAIASLSANASSYIDNNLPGGTTFCYRVNAYNAVGSSGYSNEQCGTTASSTHLLSISKAGTGSGTVTAAGINCGSDCSETVNSGMQVVLTATAAAGSTFAGWSGTGCSSGTVTVTGNMTCTATFNNSSTSMLTIVKNGTGSGTVSGAGINCGSDCNETVNNGTQLVLTATAAAGSTFVGWSGMGCSSGTVIVTGNITCTANFNSIGLTDRIGVYRPSTGEWFFDQNGNGAWDDCQTDFCVEWFGSADALPSVGEWDGTGLTQLGVFIPATQEGWLDNNTNDTWEGCEIDTCVGPYGLPGDLPVVGKWTSGGHDRLGLFRPSTGYWYLDKNSDGTLGSCRRDQCVHLSIYEAGDLPVAGDWKGDGVTRLGLFRPSTGDWFLDTDGNRSWNGCGKDQCISLFGGADDWPVSGDWSGSGASRIGIFRPNTGEWFLDYNGNGIWDGCDVDVCVSSFGIPGDLPVVGKW
jgi:Divergent InlB B-repeat domain